jgi:DNA-binding transcriptional regulator YhcF (GntR family)
MTPRQQHLVDFIKTYIADNRGISPSLIEMAKFMKVNISSVHQMISNLEQEGVLARNDCRSQRNVVLVDHQLRADSALAFLRTLADDMSVPAHHRAKAFRIINMLPKEMCRPTPPTSVQSLSDIKPTTLESGITGYDNSKPNA